MRGREGALRRRRPRRTCSSASSTSSTSSSRWGSPRTSSSSGTSCATRKSRGIRVGPGRGSAAGSCVAYCLRIVDIDPIKYDLLFERFLNPGRKQMPDIDMDFDSRYRGEMIRYAAQNATATTTSRRSSRSPRSRRGPRCATRPACSATRTRSATRSPSSCRRSIMGRDTPLHACFEPTREYADGYKMAAELRELYDADPDAKRVDRRRARASKACAARTASTPPRSSSPASRSPSTCRSSASPSRARAIEDAPIVTQYEMHGVEDLGLLKMDFLGLRNLDVIEIALDLIERSHRRRVPTSTTCRSTTPRRSSCCSGPTRSACSSSKAGRCARCCARSRRPRFEDVAAARSRSTGPGPMAQNWHNEYADRKNGRKPVTLRPPRPRGDPRPHLRADDLPRAADARRADGSPATRSKRPTTSARRRGKKIRELIAQGAREVRRRAASRNGHAEEFGESYFDTIEPFADYSFNKSHTRRLRLITYQTAWLKANYPVAVPRRAAHEREDATWTRPRSTSTSAGSSSIPVLVPDVNASVERLRVRARRRRRRARRDPVRAVGGAQRRRGRRRRSIIEERETSGPFADFYDFCERVDPIGAQQAHDRVADQGRRVRLARPPAQGLLHVFEPIVDAALAPPPRARPGHDEPVRPRRRRRRRRRCFDDRLAIPDVEFDKAQRLAFEKEMLGLYVSDHPLMGAERHAAPAQSTARSPSSRELDDGAMRDRRRRRHRPRAEVHEARRPDGHVRARGPRRRDRGDGVPEDHAASRASSSPTTRSCSCRGRVDGREDVAKLMCLDVTVLEAVE